MKILSKGIRDNEATYLDQFRRIDGSPLTREQHIEFLEEYMQALFYIERRPDLKYISSAVLVQRFPFISSIMGNKGIKSLFSRIMNIHAHAASFGVKLGD